MTNPAFSTPVVDPAAPIIIQPKEAIAIACLTGLQLRVDPDGKFVGQILLALEKSGWRLVRAD